MSPVAVEQIRYALEEIEKHGKYSVIGIEILEKAVKNAHWSAIKQIIPMCILDLFIQTEQILNVAYLLNAKKLSSSHSLLDTTKKLGLLPNLSNSTKTYLENVDLATIWVRYPKSQLDFYHTRAGLTVPDGLKLIKSSQSYNQNQDTNFRSLRSILQDFFCLYSSSMQANQEILAKMQIENQFLPLYSENYFSNIVRQMSNQVLSGTVIATTPNSLKEGLVIRPSNQMGIKELMKCQNKIEEMILNLDIRIQRCTPISSQHAIFLKTIKNYVENAKWNLMRIIENSNMQNLEKDQNHLSWFLRNEMGIQFVFEALYTVSWLLRGQYAHSTLFSHKLEEHHEKMKEDTAMNPKAFSFIKRMQYNKYIPGLSKEAETKVNFLVYMEQYMQEKCEINNEIYQQYEEEFDKSVKEASELLFMHIERCMTDLKSFPTIG